MQSSQQTFVVTKGDIKISFTEKHADTQGDQMRLH